MTVYFTWLHTRSALVTWANVDNDDDGDVDGNAACYRMTPIRDASPDSQVGGNKVQRSHDLSLHIESARDREGVVEGGWQGAFEEDYVHYLREIC